MHSDLDGSRFHCAICLAPSARSVHVYRLHRQEPWAIAQPWHDFRKEGNSYFLFSLVIGFALFIFGVLLSVPLILFVLKGRYYFFIHRDQLDVYLISAIAAWAFAVILFVLAWSLVANFMVPVMYARRSRAAKAFGIVAKLIADSRVKSFCIVCFSLFWPWPQRSSRACDLRDLLHRCDSLCRHRDFVARVCFASFILAFVSASIRPGVRRVGEFHTTGVFCCFIVGTCAAGTAFASGRLKRRHESSKRELRED